MKKFDDSDPTTPAFPGEFRRILLLDFDGVLHLDDGWKGPTVILGPIIEGALDWIRKIVNYRDDQGRLVFDLQIYSSRSRYEGGVTAMQEWLLAKGLEFEVLAQISFPTAKTPAWLTIDDRCFRFEGTFPTPEWMIHFQSWTKQMPAGPGDAEFLREVAAGGDKWVQFDAVTDGTALTAEQQRRLRGIADWVEGIYHTREEV